MTTRTEHERSSVAKRAPRVAHAFVRQEYRGRRVAALDLGLPVSSLLRKGDLHRQLLMLVSGGHVDLADIDAWVHSSLGWLWRPKNFYRGIAIHGYEEVPSYAASHGCVRLSIEAMNIGRDAYRNGPLQQGCLR